MYLSDSLRILLEERDRIKQMIDTTSVAARVLKEAEYTRRMMEALSPARPYMTDSAIADIERAMRLCDAMTDPYPMHPALTPIQSSPTFTLPPLRPFTDNESSHLNHRVNRLEHEVKELKAKINPPPPPPPREEGEESTGGQYL
jgi:hypothetical protein